MPWISFDALPCGGKKTWRQLASRCCWNRARPWHASELVTFLVGLRAYQHRHDDLIVTFRNSAKAPKNQCPMSAAGRIVGQFWIQHTFRTEEWSNLSALHIRERKSLNDPVRCAKGSRKTKTRKQFTKPRTKTINFLRDKENSKIRQDRSVFVRVKCKVSMSTPWRYMGGKCKGKVHLITGHEGAEGE